MAIFRVKHDKDYTVMSNYHLRDPALSLKASVCSRKCWPCQITGTILLQVWPTLTARAKERCVRQ